MGAIRVSGEFHNVGFLETENILEPIADGLQDLLALGGVTGDLVSRSTLANSPCPQTDTVEALTDVHNNTHDLVVIIVLEGLTNRSQLSVQPQVIDRDGALVLERVRPLATVLVMGVFPLWPDALLEKVVVCLETQFGGRCDVVLIRELGQRSFNGEAIRQINDRRAYVDSPELFDGVECDHFLQQIVPVIALSITYQSANYPGYQNRPREPPIRTLPLGGLVNQRVHSCIKGCLTVKFSGSWKTVTSPFAFSSVATPGAVFSSLTGAGACSTAAIMIGGKF